MPVKKLVKQVLKEKYPYAVRELVSIGRDPAAISEKSLADLNEKLMRRSSREHLGV